MASKMKIIYLLLQVSLIIFKSFGIESFPLYNGEIENGPSKSIHYFEPLLFPMDTQRRISRSITEDNNDEELLDTAAQTRNYYYYPYFRIRRISQRRYDDRPLRPYSNYANDYDKFPTVA